jgi:type III restriction enzyme
MSGFEVPEAIICSPFEEPAHFWHLEEGRPPEKRPGRRPSLYYYPLPQRDEAQGTGMPQSTTIELKLVNLIRARVNEWRAAGYPGATATTVELLRYWRRDGRRFRFFFAQLEAVETIVFLNEARRDFVQGIDIPSDEPSDQQKRDLGYKAFRRYACKMATGSGKTTVMGMLAAWSILNKVHDRSNARYSDVVLVVCPNVTIRSRLAELDPKLGDASLYRKADVVPEHLLPDLTQGLVLVTNWHVFEPQTAQAGGVGGRVVKAGRREVVTELIHIGPKTTTARGRRYLTLDDYNRQVLQKLLDVLDEQFDRGSLKYARVRRERYVESDTALVNRVLGVGARGKQNILVLNDEAHHAYRIRKDEPDPNEENLLGEDEDADDFFKEATVWVEGLDRIQKLRGINFCVDLSATPYFLGRVGQETNRPFPWVISDFPLTDAIESGLVKIPQLAVRDTTGAEIPGYFNIWRWILPQLTSAERGGSQSAPKPEAILKWANTPITMLGSLWEMLRAKWAASNDDDPRPPVFIIVCKNIAISKVVYEWLAENRAPIGIPPSTLSGLLNTGGRIHTIRVDSRVVNESDSGHAKSEDVQWMRFTLDTAGRTAWPTDGQGRAIYPEGFEALAVKRGQPLSPPGREVRCIVSVGMLTEGWDCNTVTHIVGLRPFMSQLLCEQVVGRGLRRRTYELGENGLMTEEVATVFGVPFHVVPFKANPTAGPAPTPKRHHVHALPDRAHLAIAFPRVEGYRQAIRNRVTVDWASVPPLALDPGRIPPEVEVKGSLPVNSGRPSLTGPGRLQTVDLNPFRSGRRLQELVFEMAADLTREYVAGGQAQAPAHVLFPQLARIVERYIEEKVHPAAPAHRLDLFLSPYYGWAIERLVASIRPDTSQGEAPEVPRYEINRGPGSTADVDYWTSRDVREVVKSHVNYVVADTQKWEQQAAYILDSHPAVDAFVKNAGLGFAIPYLHNGQPHDYVPDFIVRMNGSTSLTLILETKGYDPLADVKTAAAQRWVDAVNADGQFGRWRFEMARAVPDVRRILDAIR